MKSIVYTIIASILVFAPLQNILTAQTVTKKLPGDTTLPSSKKELMKLASYEKGSYKYSIEDFVQYPTQFSFQFSPTGLYLSYKERDEAGKIHLYIKNTITDEITRVLEQGEDLIREYGWANNERIYYLKDNGGNEIYHLFAVDINGKNRIELTPFDNVETVIVNDLKAQKKYMIIKMNKDNHQVYEPYMINIETGDLHKLFEIKNSANQIHSFFFDNDGVLRGYTQLQNGTEYEFFYRSNQNEPFQQVVKWSSKDKFKIIDFDYSTENPDDAFVISNINSNTDEIISFDFGKKRVSKRIFSNATYDVKGLACSQKRAYEIEYFYYEAEKNTIVPVSKTYTKLHNRFAEYFKDKCFSITDKTFTEDKYLLFVESDKLYGMYFLYDAKKDKFKELLNCKPNLKEEDMAEVRPIKFTSRDSLTIYGYLTFPKESKTGKKVPLIVHPHGGPHYVRDSWGFNPENQLFANRGYAVLQINYRGSHGYGKEFYQASFKQIGRKMLNDIEDGISYVKTLDLINENKIAIYGGSYAGLATLQSLIKTPDLYTCGVDYVGPTNLFTFFESMPPYMKPRMNMLYAAWYNPNIEEEKQIMKEVSPALNIDKLNKPIFVIQGANDPRVNINESDRIVRMMRERGFDIPYMVKYNEGHGFVHEENEIELYNAMLGFFAKYLK